MRRPRGPGGRFLTAEEVSQMEAGGGLPEGSNGEMKPNGSATKRKAGEMNGNGDMKSETPTKKIKSDDDEDEDDEGDEDDG